jgi:hypothetical protein
MEISAEILRDRIASSMRRREDLDKECEENIKRMSHAEKKAYDEAVDEAMLIRNIERATGKIKVSGARTIAEPQRLALRYTEDNWYASHVGLEMVFWHARGLTLLTTAEELAETASTDGNFGHRKVYVARGYLVREKPAQINNLLFGLTSIRTDAEVDATIKTMGEIQKARQPKGSTTNHDQEDKATRDLCQMIGYKDSTPGIEFRLSDNLCKSLKDNVDDNVYVGDQVKSSHLHKGAHRFWNLDIGKAILMLGGGDFIGKGGRKVAEWMKMSITLIGLDSNHVPEVVWYLWGKRAVDMLMKYEHIYGESQKFETTPFPTRKRRNEFLEALDEFRYDVLHGRGNMTGASECARLRAAKEEFAGSDYATHAPAEFWNEDLSQIPLDGHKMEQVIMNRMRELLGPVCLVKRASIDNYGPVDYRFIDLATGVVSRIQSKKMSGTVFSMRKKNGLPYDLMKDFDSLDVADTDIVLDDAEDVAGIDADDVAGVDAADVDDVEGVDADVDAEDVADVDADVPFKLIIWSLPARMLVDGKFVPYLTKAELRRKTVSLSKPWRKKHKEYQFDLNTAIGRAGYRAQHIMRGTLAQLMGVRSELVQARREVEKLKGVMVQEEEMELEGVKAQEEDLEGLKAEIAQTRQLLAQAQEEVERLKGAKAQEEEARRQADAQLFVAQMRSSQPPRSAAGRRRSKRWKG